MLNQILLDEHEFWKILTQVPKAKTLSYRLYYDSVGNPITYTMDELPGSYVEIDQKAFAESNPHVRVLNGKICDLLKTSISKKLVPALSGTACHPSDVTIVTDDQQIRQCWKLASQEVTR